MTITLEAQDLLMALLNGNLCDHVALPRAVGEKLKGHEEIVVEDNEPTACFVTIWSPFGWENEQRRRDYWSQTKGADLKRPTPCKATALSEYC